MPPLKTNIGAFDAGTKSVAVTFTSGKIKHQRSVNAVLNDRGEYDAAATAERVDQVAAGVTAKIAAGAIANTPAPKSQTENAPSGE